MERKYITNIVDDVRGAVNTFLSYECTGLLFGVVIFFKIGT